ncbi:MAG: HD-GYP domain-containing protein [Nitrospinae bacterium]|nr:HD-GYP domain-containing protein [Nitrospinota bacterium]
MIKKVVVHQLKPGMHIHDFNADWLAIPFFRRSLLLKDEGMIEKIVKYGIREVYRDSARRLDVRDAPTQIEVEEVIQAKVELIAGNEILPAPEVPFEEEMARAVAVRRQAEKTVFTFMKDVRDGKRIDMGAVDETVHNMTNSVFENMDAMLCLGQLRRADEYTFQHSVNSCIIMLAFGRGLGLEREKAGVLGMGGLLHDIGKMKVPNEVLNKPGQLTDQEFETIKRHAVYGGEILVERGGIPAEVVSVAREHHERHDGTGYPSKLKGGEISKSGQMAATVDVYDAITLDRCYHAGMTPGAALRKLYEWSEFHFNRELVERFIKCIGVYPIGTTVRMESGHLALVIKGTGKMTTKPTVRLTYDIANQTRLRTTRDIDLSTSDGSDKILGSESPKKWGINTSAYLSELVGGAA